MGRKKVNYKVGERIAFQFAGEKLEGKIMEIKGSGKNLRYQVHDGKYLYPVSKDSIL